MQKVSISPKELIHHVEWQQRFLFLPFICVKSFTEFILTKCETVDD